MDKHPTLALIDAARGQARAPFATEPVADVLERIAHELVDAYWSELAWLTGTIPHHAFEVVCRRLEHHRLQFALADAD
jgi:hypothetical protein